MLSDKILQLFGDKIAVITEKGKRYTFSDLNDFSSDLYSKIGHRCLVFCLCRNSIESLTGYLSFLTNRVVSLMLDASQETSMLKTLISVYKPEYIWLPSVNREDFEKEEAVYEFGGYVLLHLNHGNAFPLHDDLALLLTTSGSTGSPKLVRLSYENLFSNAESIVQYLDIDDRERPVTSLPMHYSFGLSVINSHLLKGAALLLTSRSLMEKEFWTFLKSEKATSLSGVPYTYEMLKKLRFHRMDLPSLKTLTQAGGKLNDELNRDFSEFCQQSGKRFIVMYGQTEATARMSYLPPQFSLLKLGSMGKAVPGGKFSLIDENGKTVEEPEIIGELVYTGRNVSLGYAECGDDLRKGDENRGRLITGDLAKRDSDGFYYIVGRKKRFIKIFGNRVNLDEAERLLKNIIHDCACGGEDDHMIIYITDISRKDEILSFITGKTGIHPQGFSVKQVDRIPKNSSGKTNYSQLTF